MSEQLRLRGAAAQLTGPRGRQNDSFGYGRRWVVVADGAGDDVGARRAADEAVDRIEAVAAGSLQTSVVVAALLAVPAAVSKALGDRGNVNSATLVAAIIDDDNRIWLTTLGDSVIMLLRDNEVVHLSRQHNRAEVQEMLDGKVSDAQSRAFLTRSVGPSAHVPDLSVVEARQNDTVVAFSDGIHGSLEGDFRSLVDIAGVGYEPEQLRANDLVTHAASIGFRRGGGDFVRGLADNATVVVATVIGPRDLGYEDEDRLQLNDRFQGGRR